MACRLPGGANTPEAFWTLLEQGGSAIVDIPRERWNHDNFFDSVPGTPGRTAANQAGFLESVYDFDADFFGISPREAESIDPQHRLLLELAYEAFERAGYPLGDLEGSATGVFIGLTCYDMYHDVGAFGAETYTATGVSPAMAANRISHTFDLRGPSLTVDTACSASLTALDLARRSLATGQCQQALVGAVNLLLDPALFLAFSRLGMLSPSNRCQAFDAGADGFVRGEGAVMLLLKPWSEIRERDRVEAMILHTEINQDGRTPGITVPNQQAQEALLTAAYADGDLARRLFAIETHGTGTPVGDPIEARAISGALGLAPNRRLWLGAVKTNIGHLEGAAGAAGLLKAILSLRHKKLPANLHFRQSPPKLDLDALGLAVPTQIVEIPDNAVLGVSSFGFGGSSAHAVLQSPPAREARRDGEPPEPTRDSLLLLSARSPEALRARAQQFLALLEQTPESDFAPIIFSAAVRATHHRYRAAFHGDTALEVADSLRLWLEERPHGSAAIEDSPVFVFSGQGPQWWGMGRELLERQPVFRQAVGRIDLLLQDLGGSSVLELLMASEADSRLAETEFAQPAIFALQAGLVELLASWGVRPKAVVGHSVGEIAAAFAAGVLTLEQATTVVYHRAVTMQHGSRKGAMLSVQCPLETVTAMLEPWSGQLEIGAVNGPHDVSVSGLAEAVEAFQAWLESKSVPCRRIPVQYAFHSFLVDEVRDPLRAILAPLRPAPARIPILSTVEGARLEGPEMDAEYWWKNVRQPVLFAQAVRSLMKSDHGLFLEVGPHPVLTSSLLDNSDALGKSVATFACLRRGSDQNRSLLQSLGQLWSAGVEVDWRALYPATQSVLLPPYPWQRRTYRSTARDRRRGLFAEPPVKRLGVREDHSMPTWRASFAVGPSVSHSLEMALEAAACLWGRARGLRLRQLQLAPPPASGSEQAQTCLDPVSGLVTVAAMIEGGWSMLLRGRAEPWEKPAVDARPLPAEMGAELPALDPEWLPQRVESWGHRMETAPSRCALEGQALLLELDCLEDQGEAFLGAVLEVALLSGLGLREPSIVEPPRAMVLESVEELSYFCQPSGRVRVVCELEASDQESWVTRVRVTGSTGLCLEARGVRWSPRERSAEPPLADRFLLTAQWQVVSLSQPPSGATRWCGPGSSLFSEQPDVGTGPVEHTAYVAGQGESLEQLQRVLELATASERPARERLVLITQGAQSLTGGDRVSLSQAPLLGFWRCLQLESPHRRPLMIDLPAHPAPADLACVPSLLESPENELVVRNGQALAPRWRHLSLAELSSRPGAAQAWCPSWAEHGTCLVSGGLTGVGAAVTRWLVKAGARHLLVVSRRGESTPGATELLDELQAGGAMVRVVGADVSTLTELPLRGLPPLRAVFHAAGHIEDGIIENLDQARFERALRPKAMGAWRLHELSLDHPIEHFVLFSSISGAFGAAGQASYASANTFLDAIAHDRLAQGLPALSVCWGPIADAGHLQQHPEILAALRAQGYRPMPIWQCLQILNALMRHQAGVVAVADAHWQALERGPRLQLLHQASADLPSSDKSQEPTSIMDFLQLQAERILRLCSHPDLQARPLRELGLDSVMAVEFRNAIETRFRLTLPVQSILSGPSLQELGELVREQLASTPASDNALLPHLSDQEVKRLLAQLEDHDSAAHRPPSGT